jgi:hypothetical protein
MAKIEGGKVERLREWENDMCHPSCASEKLLGSRSSITKSNTLKFGQIIWKNRAQRSFVYIYIYIQSFSVCWVENATTKNAIVRGQARCGVLLDKRAIHVIEHFCIQTNYFDNFFHLDQSPLLRQVRMHAIHLPKENEHQQILFAHVPSSYLLIFWSLFFTKSPLLIKLECMRPISQKRMSTNRFCSCASHPSSLIFWSHFLQSTWTKNWTS